MSNTMYRNITKPKEKKSHDQEETTEKTNQKTDWATEITQSEIEINENENRTKSCNEEESIQSILEKTKDLQTETGEDNDMLKEGQDFSKVDKVIVSINHMEEDLNGQPVAPPLSYSTPYVQNSIHNNAFIEQTPVEMWPFYENSTSSVFYNNSMMPNIMSEVLNFDSSMMADMSSYSIDTSLMADASINFPMIPIPQQEMSSIFNDESSLIAQSPSIHVQMNSNHDLVPKQPSSGEEDTNVSYPLVYVSPAGLLTVLLKHDVAVELTADHTIRVVNHKHKCVAATNKRASAACIYHTAAKIYQDGTHIDAEIFWDRKASLTPASFHYGWDEESFEVNGDGVITYADYSEFKDLSKDNSVTLLFSSSAYGPHLVQEYERIASASKFHYLPGGAVSVYINGVKIKQSARGEVTVTSGPKFIRVSPINGSVTVNTHFVDMAVDKHWNTRVKRGGHLLSATFNHFFVSDGSWQYGFDKNRNHVYAPLKTKVQCLVLNGKPQYYRDRSAYEVARRTHKRIRTHLYRMNKLQQQLLDVENRDEVPFQLGGSDNDNDDDTDSKRGKRGKCGKGGYRGYRGGRENELEQEEDAEFFHMHVRNLPPRFRNSWTWDRFKH